MNLTITTCLYDIRKKENSTCQNVTGLDDYLKLSQHMLSLRLPLVIYTDDDFIMDHVYKTRAEYGLLEKTLIVRLPFEQTFFYKDLDILKQRMQEYTIGNWNKDKDTPLYTLLNNNKFDFLQRTIDANPFGTEFFLWMDMGIQHCTKATKKQWLDVSETWPEFISQDKEHIHQLRIHTVLKAPEMSWKDYFRMIYHHVAGGLFGGYKDRVLEYINLFKSQWHKIIYEEEWWQLDEAVMTIITETYPEKFRFFYGDYDGLIANFIKSKKSFHLIFQTAERYVNAKKYDMAWQVLETVEARGLELESWETYSKAILTMICYDFYGRGGHVSPLLKQVLLHNNIPDNIIKNQMQNIKHLKDPETIPFFVRWIFSNPENKWANDRWRQIPHKNTCQWVHLDKFSYEILGKNDANAILPFTTMEDSPLSLLNHFQTQFSSFPEQSVCSVYEILENEEQHVFFLWNTPALFYQENIGPQYEQDLLKVHGFIKRNFPSLKFHIICIYVNRSWSIPIENTPPEFVVYKLETPYFFKENLSYYYHAVCEWFSYIRYNVLFLNHKNQQCGVYQYGKRLYNILRSCNIVDYDYQEAQTLDDYNRILDKKRYNAVIYNYRDTTMPWLNANTIRNEHQNICIPHETTVSFFDKIISIDPDSAESQHFYNIPRPILGEIPADNDPCDNERFQEFVSFKHGDTPIFGSFGFGFTNKGFSRIVHTVNNQYDKAIIKLLIPCAYYGGNPQVTEFIKNECAQQITKPEILLLIYTDFVSEKDLLRFLRSNTMNMFMYDKRDGEGVSSTIDYALSVRKPLGISDSYMFRNIYDDDICLYKNSIQKCMEKSVSHCEKFLHQYNHDHMRKKMLFILLDP